MTGRLPRVWASKRRRWLSGHGTTDPITHMTDSDAGGVE